jgi:hypothetical protein
MQVITNSLLSTAFLVRTFPFLGLVSASELEVCLIQGTLADAELTW